MGKIRTSSRHPLPNGVMPRVTHQRLLSKPCSFGCLGQELTISPHPREKVLQHLGVKPVLSCNVRNGSKDACLPRCAGCGLLRLRDSAQQPDRMTVRVLFLFAFRNFRYPHYVFPEVEWPCGRYMTKPQRFWARTTYAISHMILH